MLLIKVHSQHPKNRHQYHQQQLMYLHYKRNIGICRRTGTNKDKILKAIHQLKHEDEAYHEGIIERLIHEYDDYSASCEGDDKDSTESDELNKLLTESDLDICLIDMENLDKKPAARKDSIKDTPTLRAPITESCPGKRLRQS